MAKTNSLTSHHPERRSYGADKGIPKEVMRDARKRGSGKKHNSPEKFLKKMHKKKARQYNKNKIKKELGNEE